MTLDSTLTLGFRLEFNFRKLFLLIYENFLHWISSSFCIVVTSFFVPLFFFIRIENRIIF